MYRIGQGLLIHFDNNRKYPNTVILPEGRACFYGAGEMLLELLSDQGKYILSEKPLNMIRQFPNRKDEVSKESIVEGFKWLHETVCDEDLPAASTLFQSQFSDIILDPESGAYDETYATIEDFLVRIFAIYSQQLTFFFDYCGAMMEVNSGTADVEAESEMEDLQKEVEIAYEELRRKCSKRHNDGLVAVEVLEIPTFLSLLLFESCRMKQENRKLKACACCGRPFIPRNRNDAIYCTNPAPANNGRTCQEYGPQVRWAEKLKADPVAHASRNKIASLRMAVSRADPSTKLYHRKKLVEALQEDKARRSATKPTDT